MISRLSLKGSKHPSFFGCWMLQNPALCDGLIEFFEHKKASHRPGVSGVGKVNKKIKNSTDLLIAPIDLEDEKFHIVSTYTEHLTDCYLDYLEQWDFLKSFLLKVTLLNISVDII